MNAAEVPDDKWEWACRRMPSAPQSVRLLVLNAMGRGWVCWEVRDHAVTLRNYEEHDQAGIIYEVDLVWIVTNSGIKRFHHADRTELHLLGRTRGVGGAERFLR